MRKIILILLLFFNIVPCIKNGELHFFNIERVAAQSGESYGSEMTEGACAELFGGYLDNCGNCIYGDIAPCDGEGDPIDTYDCNGD